MANQPTKINNAAMRAQTQTLTPATSRHGCRNPLDTEEETHPDVLIMESYNEDQETRRGQADGTVED